MEKTVVLIGAETAIGKKLAEFYLEKGYQIAAPVSENNIHYPQGSEDRYFPFPWNRSSYISARAFLFETHEKFGRPEMLLFVLPRLGEDKPFDKTSLTEIHEIIEEEISGFIYMVREALSRISGREGSALFIRNPENSGVLNPMAALTEGALGSFCESLVKRPRKGLFLCGVDYSGQNSSDFISFIDKCLEEKKDKFNNQWLKYNLKNKLRIR